MIPDVCMKGSPPDIEAAVEAGADVNASFGKGWTPLMIAAQCNPNSGAIDALVRAGAQVNAKLDSGWTALMSAAKDNANPEVITALIRAGADVDARNEKGWTALGFAAGNNGPEVVAALLKAGADVNVRATDGVTPLMSAAWHNPKPDVVVALVGAGADPNAHDEDGFSAIDYAERENPNPEVKDALIKCCGEEHQRHATINHCPSQGQLFDSPVVRTDDSKGTRASPDDGGWRYEEEDAGRSAAHAAGLPTNANSGFTSAVWIGSANPPSEIQLSGALGCRACQALADWGPLTVSLCPGKRQSFQVLCLGCRNMVEIVMHTRGTSTNPRVIVVAGSLKQRGPAPGIYLCEIPPVAPATQKEVASDGTDGAVELASQRKRPWWKLW